MAEENQVKQIEQLVQHMLEDYPEYFLVGLRIKPTNNVKIYIDGDKGISIEQCVFFNRQLYKILEEKNLFPAGEFSLELSSPGIDEPLKYHRQYIKNTGRLIEVSLKDGSVKTGKLVNVQENAILLETTEGKGKKKVVEQVEIAFDDIKSTTVQIQF